MRPGPLQLSPVRPRATFTEPSGLGNASRPGALRARPLRAPRRGACLRCCRDHHGERRRPLGRADGRRRRRPLHLRSGRRGRVLGRSGRGIGRPLPDHDLRQPGRGPLLHARRRISDQGLRSGHAGAHGLPRVGAGARRGLIDGRRDRAGACARGARARSQPRAERNLVPRRPLPARGLQELDVVGSQGGVDPGLSRGRQPLVLRAEDLERRDHGRLDRRCRGEPLPAVRRCVLQVGRGAHRARHGRAIGAVAAPTLVHASASSTSCCRSASRASSWSGFPARACSSFRPSGTSPSRKRRTSTTGCCWISGAGF